MAVFKHVEEAGEAHPQDFSHVASVLVADAESRIVEAGELLEEDSGSRAIEALRSGLESVLSLRAIFDQAGIEAPKLYRVLDELEAEGRSLLREAREHRRFPSSEDDGEEE